jgi:hypothetical protein
MPSQQPLVIPWLQKKIFSFFKLWGAEFNKAGLAVRDFLGVQLCCT